MGSANMEKYFLSDATFFHVTMSLRKTKTMTPQETNTGLKETDLFHLYINLLHRKFEIDQ